MGVLSERFDEIGGLPWEKKNRQIVASTLSLKKTIDAVSPPVGIDYIHINLLMFLYDIFGHEKKPLIRKLMKICTARFKPYDVDFFMRPPAYKKHQFSRVPKEFHPQTSSRVARKA